MSNDDIIFVIVEFNICIPNGSIIITCNQFALTYRFIVLPVPKSLYLAFIACLRCISFVDKSLGLKKLANYWMLQLIIVLTPGF